MEWGEDIKAIAKDEAVMLVNHQATGDVCTLMMCLQDKGPVSIFSASGGYPAGMDLALIKISHCSYSISIDFI